MNWLSFWIGWGCGWGVMLAGCLFILHEANAAENRRKEWRMRHDD